MKEWLEEIPKGALNTLGAALGCTLLALVSKQVRTVLGLSLSDTQISSIRFWLLICAIGIFLFVGWFLYFQTRRQLRLVQASLVVPHKISDDYEHVKDRGFWIHRKTGTRVCGNCLLPPIEVVSPLSAVRLANPLDFGRTSAPVWKCERRDCGKTYARRDNDT